MRGGLLLPLLLLLAILPLTGCGQASHGGTGRAANPRDLDDLKPRMTELFSALEMYAADHSMAYPEKAQELVPKYLDAVPVDPLTGEPLTYEKTERGYLLYASGDYSSAGAQSGFPRMNQDGFFALKPDDFPGDLPEP